MADRSARTGSWRPAFTAVGVVLFLALLLVRHSPAHGLSRDEHNELLKSIRPDQLSWVEKATGGLENLPLVRLDISLDLAAHTIDGTARLDWRNTTGQSLTKLPVRLPANSDKPDGPTVTWTELRVTVPGHAPAIVKSHRINVAIQEITLPAPLAPGAWVSIEGNLKGQMAELAAGATDPVQASMAAIGGGRSKATADQYGTFACGEKICTLTSFTPDVPEWSDGDFDTALGSGIGDWPGGDPQNALLDVTTDIEVKVTATGMNIGHTPAPGLKQKTRFVMAATREIGLVASTDFIQQSADVDGVHVTSWSLSDDKDAGAKVLKAATESLKTFDEAFGPYPWTFLNVTESALIGGAGGDELPGLTLNGSAFYHSDGGSLTGGIDSNSLKALGMNPDSLDGLGSTGMFGAMLDFITRHEVAHQWWYAMVGSDPQKHPYVDEPLAQWSALYSVRQNEGEEAAKSARDLQIAINFQALGLLGATDGKVARPAGEFESPIEYAGLVYGKAPLFFEAAAKKFGTAKVVEALRAFVKAERFQTTTPEKELKALEDAVGEEHAPAMHKLWRHWFEETHGQQDVGGLDMGSLASQMGVSSDLLNGLSAQIDPKTMKDTLKALQDLMKDMPSGNSSDSSSDQDTAKLFHDLMKEMSSGAPSGNGPDAPSNDE